MRFDPVHRGRVVNYAAPGLHQPSARSWRARVIADVDVPRSDNSRRRRHGRRDVCRSTYSEVYRLTLL